MEIVAKALVAFSRTKDTAANEQRPAMELREGSVRTEETTLVMDVADMKIPKPRRIASVHCSTWFRVEVQRLPMRHANRSKTSEPR